MEYRPLDLTVVSASGLKNVNWFMRMSVYVVVSLINGDSVTKRKTHVSKGCNPKWNHRIKFSVEESAVQNSTLIFLLRCSRILGDRNIGEVSIPVCDLLETDSCAKDAEHVVDYQVRSMKGKSRGTFTFSYRFTGKPGAVIKNKEDSVGSYGGATARPSHSNSPGTMMMPPAAPYPPASYPPPQGYGGGGAWHPPATPPPPGAYPYGYNQQQVPQKQ